MRLAEPQRSDGAEQSSQPDRTTGIPKAKTPRARAASYVKPDRTLNLGARAMKPWCSLTSSVWRLKPRERERGGCQNEKQEWCWLRHSTSPSLQFQRCLTNFESKEEKAQAPARVSQELTELRGTWFANSSRQLEIKWRKVIGSDWNVAGETLCATQRRSTLRARRVYEACTGLRIFLGAKVLCALFWNLHSLPFLPLSPLECKLCIKQSMHSTFDPMNNITAVYTTEELGEVFKVGAIGGAEWCFSLFNAVPIPNLPQFKV